ncbi:MAG: hypothetical protein IJT97_06815 [Bacteroidaceae bacterium]|nr:hypothetical protein [Bacteroidaceae bacterium]
MQTTISLDTMLHILQPLSPDSKKWIADRLYEDIGQKKKNQIREKAHKLHFPHIPSDFQVSQEIHENAIGALPEGIDFETEVQKMWEDLAS